MPTIWTDGSASATAQAYSATPVPTSSTAAPGWASRSDKARELAGDGRCKQASGRGRCTSLSEKRVVVRVPSRVGDAFLRRFECLSHRARDRLTERLAALGEKVGDPWRENDLSVRALGRQPGRDEDAFGGRVEVIVRPSQPHDRRKDPKVLDQLTDPVGGFIGGLHEIPGGHPLRLPVRGSPRSPPSRTERRVIRHSDRAQNRAFRPASDRNCERLVNGGDPDGRLDRLRQPRDCRGCTAMSRRADAGRCWQMFPTS